MSPPSEKSSVRARRVRIGIVGVAVLALTIFTVGSTSRRPSASPVPGSSKSRHIDGTGPKLSRPTRGRIRKAKLSEDDDTKDTVWMRLPSRRDKGLSRPSGRVILLRQSLP